MKPMLNLSAINFGIWRNGVLINIAIKIVTKGIKNPTKKALLKTIQCLREAFTIYSSLLS
ncbi:MAG: hypothetical protein UR87_C0011G0020 [candidate division CPR3 bacterium GW2011_GWE2_35_7]|nr:MAG: hypothetical protein UR87_C0011G0020 [candidate division CPR3 bacterium GW2011_GWE2_35_7]